VQTHQISRLAKAKTGDRRNGMKMADHQKGLLITILGVLFVVPDSLFVRLIASEPLIIAFWRSLAAGVMTGLFLILFQRGYSFRNLFLMGKLGWVYCFLIGSTSPAFVIAVENTSVANVVFIFASMPIFSAVLSRIFLKEKISSRTIITIVLVVIGLSVIAYGSGISALSHWHGDIWALYISLAYASALTIVRHLKHISMIPAIPVAYIGSAFIVGFFVNPLNGFEANASFYLCHGICIALGTCFLALSPRYLSTPEVSLLILLESVLAPLLVWLIIDETPGLWAVMGGAIVIGSLTISNVLAYKKGKAIKL
jgi:drug/metabolite transporter (DMT)-like permease